MNLGARLAHNFAHVFGAPLPSRMQVGDPARYHGALVRIAAVRFSDCKVSYDVTGDDTYASNVNSLDVEPVL